MGKIFIIGIGSKARMGKDQSALYMTDMRKHVYTMHFADVLKEECANKDRKYPLIIQCITSKYSGYTYGFLDDAKIGNYTFVGQYDCPLVHKIFTDRNIKEYAGMDGKDAPILQLWGTNFRRNLTDDKYWIHRINDNIQKIIDDTADINDNIYILIPDTRFRNEYNFVKSFRYGTFLRVERMLENGENFYAIDRPRDHPSEVDLDETKEDYLIQATNLEELKLKDEQFLNEIDKME